MPPPKNQREEGAVLEGEGMRPGSCEMRIDSGRPRIRVSQQRADHQERFTCRSGGVAQSMTQNVRRHTRQISLLDRRLPDGACRLIEAVAPLCREHITVGPIRFHGFQSAVVAAPSGRTLRPAFESKISKPLSRSTSNHFRPAISFRRQPDSARKRATFTALAFAPPASTASSAAPRRVTSSIERNACACCPFSGR